MRNRGTKWTMILLAAAIAAGGYGMAKESCAANSAAKPRQEIARQTDRTAGATENREQSEKREAFEKRLAEKRAKFEREYNEVKERNDEIREKFDQCRDVSEEELRAHIANNLEKHTRK